MAKKNWRDSGAEVSNAGKRTVGRGDSADSDSSGAAGKAVTLLLAAGLLGGLIAFLFKIIWPAVVTPVLFYESFPHSQGKTALSTNVFKSETMALIGNEKENGDLELIEANLESPSNVETIAGGPQKNVAFFYVYADIVSDQEGKPLIITSGDATEPSANRELIEFLREACTLDLEGGGEEPETGNQRVVVLDTGRLDAPSFATVVPKTVASSIKSCVETLKSQKVPNVENLWVMLSTDDFQLGWSAPELNSSVFGYFFSRGLKGDADADEDQIVTLAELHNYVRESTARWVQDYRDSVQTPILIAGGDLEESNAVQLIYHHNEASQVLTAFQTDRKVDPKLWKSGFRVQQPHRRQAICSKLIRMEQLRFCNSAEFNELTREVDALLKDAEARYTFEGRTKTSVFAELSFEELKLAFNTVDDLKEILDAKSAMTAKERRAKEAQEEAAAKKESEKEEAADDGEAAKEKPIKLTSRLGKLTPQQRLALIWHYLRHGDDASMDLEKLKKLLNVIRLKTDMRACNELVEMQFLNLLFNNLPWEEPDFDNSILLDAITSFDHSQSLTEGTLTSHSELKTNDVRLGDQDRSVVFSNWKHFEDSFGALEHQRRRALDLAIAGKTEDSKREFDAVIKSYNSLNGRMKILYDARKQSNDILFVLPYVKSFSLRKAVYRNEVVEGDDSSSTEFHPSLSSIIELENVAKQISEQITGPAMSDEQFQEVVQMYEASKTQASKIKEPIALIAGELATTQSASKYAFESQTLLGTPIPEWIDDGQSTLRVKILAQLDEQLLASQQKFFEAERTDQESPIDVNQLADDHRQAAEKKLASFANEQENCLSAMSLASELQSIEDWNQLQTAIKNLPNIDDLKTATEDESLNKTSLPLELLRLDGIDRKIRTSDPGIGLTKRLSDISQQQNRLLLFDWESRKLNRAVRDFWGSGDVTEIEQPTPFISRVNKHAKNLEKLADSTKIFIINDKEYRAYDPDSLARLSQELKGYAEKTWDKFSKLQGAWTDDGKALAIGANQLLIPESASKRLGLGLTGLDSVLADEGFFPQAESQIQNTFSKQIIGQRVKIGEQAFFDELDVSDDVVNNTQVKGDIYFRGHWFKSDLWILRQRNTLVPSAPYVFDPPYLRSDKSWISVINQENKTVDVIFLLDCSGSMSEKLKVNKGHSLYGMTRMKVLKDATRDIILELAKSKRFYIGLAAFGHRVRFEDPIRVENGLLEVFDPNGTGAHPFNDWQMLFRLPKQPSDEASVGELFDQLTRLTHNGLTPLYYSMVKTLAGFPRTGRKQILIVVTDGDDQQIPNRLTRSRAAAFPRGKGDGDLTTLSQVQTKMSQSNVQVLMLRISKDFTTQLQLPPPHRVVGLNENFKKSMRDSIYNFIGRYKFSVKPVGQGASIDDYRDMGPRKEEIEVSTPKSNFVINAHDVAVPAAPRTITLNGGEDLEFVYENGEINLNDSQTKSAEDRFLSPKIKSLIPLGPKPQNHKIGRLANDNFNVVFGFAGQRGVSHSPDRLWARVTELQNGEEKQRVFDITRPTRRFLDIPNFSFRIPDAIKSQNINVTLYVLPGDQKASTVTEADGQTNFIEFEGVVSGEFRGLKYNVTIKDGTQDRFMVEITANKFIESAFHLECPNSKPIEISSTDKKRVIHDLVFMGNHRSKETFEFEIPESKSATFKLYAQPKEKYEAAINDRPASQNFKKCKDPIFGDDVIAIQFDGIELKR